jgi:hypothetical protein
MAIQIKRRAWIGALIGAAAVGGWASWTRNNLLVPQVSVAPVTPKSFVQLAGSDQTLREKADLLDPTPLFFPTERNYGQRPLPQSALKQPGQVFGSFEPKLTVADQNITPYRNETTPVPEKLSDVLTQGNEAPFAGMGQVDLQTSTLPIRSGYLEVSDLKNGDIVISQTLSGLNAPRSDFAPMEFLVVVGAAGVVGDPFLLSGSGGEEMDNFLRSYLVKSYRLGERLRPGRYRVLVGA